MRTCLIVFATLALLGCEQGWQLEGEVTTDGVTRRDRPLLVLVVMDPVLQADGLPARDDRIAHVVVNVAAIPAGKQTFSFAELGCVEDTFQLIAWSPGRPRTINRQTVPLRAFDPEPGDLLAFTPKTPITNCGYSGTQHISLRLGDGAPAP